MINSFAHYTPPLIQFGSGKISLLPVLAGQFGKRILIITGSSRFQQTEIWERLLRDLKQASFSVFSESVSGEPSPGLVDDITQKYRNPVPDSVIAIGGGSVMDTGKAVSAMLLYEASSVSFLEGIGTLKHDGRKIPFIAVPTTSGTGSEATKNAVLSRIGPDGYKKSIRHDRFIPDIALVDPALTVSCPPPLTAASGMDAFTQLLESYVSSAATPVTDALAFSGLQRVVRSLEKTVSDGDDMDARTDMSYAAIISGITLANAGLGVAHGFASSIGGLFSIPHGVICGSLMAPCTELTIRKLIHYSPDHAALHKFGETGQLLCSEKSRNQSYYCEYLIDRLYELSEELRIPGLNQFGVTHKDVDLIISQTENKNNPVLLDQEDLRCILLKRIK